MKRKQAFPDLFRHLFLAWLTAALVEYLLIPRQLADLSSLEGIAAMSFPRLLVVTAVLTAGLWLVNRHISIALIERWVTVGVFALLAIMALTVSYTPFMLLVCLLVLAILVFYGIMGCNTQPAEPPQPQKPQRLAALLTGGLALLFACVLSAWTVARICIFFTPTFDFGLFAQMFHNMKETGLPTTTLERDGPLSHFAVHVSPIYYLMLPIYWLFPEPATLQILQAVVLSSAVIPMWLIGKQNGFSGWLRLLLCLTLLLLPAVAGGTDYDIHENCFLLPCILWLMYAIDRRSVWLCVLFGVLTAFVKEDAAVYVAVAALYLILRTLKNYSKEKQKDLLIGISLLVGAIGWFILVTTLLSVYGDGVMNYRYDNFMYEKSGSLITVIKAVLLCPLKLLYECVDTEKLKYIFLTLTPLLGLPLLTRKFERYVLLIPYILLNLMSDYPYQHDITFQYNFGSTAFLLYLTAVNVADLKIPKLKAAWVRLGTLAATACLAAVLFAINIVPHFSGYLSTYYEYQDYYDGISQALENVPPDVSVAATTFYTTKLSSRETVYDIRYCSEAHLLACDVVVLKHNSEADYKRFIRPGKTGLESMVELLTENGYEPYYQYGNIFTIYRQTR